MKRIVFLILLAVIAASAVGCENASGHGSADNGLPAVHGTSEDTGSADYIYGIPMDEKAGVITESVADIYAKPDVKSARITQALYNQPVSILREEPGWAMVTVVDGSSGWIKLKYIDKDVSSIYGRTFTHRIIVTSREKTVTSDPKGGVTRVIAPMGTEFYAFNNMGDAYEVFLPGNKTGWIDSSGIIHIGLGDKVSVTNADDFAATALRLKGASYLINGMSARGIDAPGLVYICARINGIDLPRSIEGQMASGVEIKPEDAQAGDLLFLAGQNEDETETATCVGIATGGGSYIYAGKRIGYVAVGDVNKENAEGRIVAARRIFN